MTKAAACVLLYLDRYLLTHPDEKKKLLALHEKTTGRKLDEKSLWRHTKRKIEPGFGTALVYLIFLSKQGKLVSSAEPGALFTYKHPEWLKKK